MEMEKAKVLIQFLLFVRQSGDVLFFLHARRLRGYTATHSFQNILSVSPEQVQKVPRHLISGRSCSCHCLISVQNEF